MKQAIGMIFFPTFVSNPFTNNYEFGTNSFQFFEFNPFSIMLALQPYVTRKGRRRSGSHFVGGVV